MNVGDMLVGKNVTPRGLAGTNNYYSVHTAAQLFTYACSQCEISRGSYSLQIIPWIQRSDLRTLRVAVKHNFADNLPSSRRILDSPACMSSSDI